MGSSSTFIKNRFVFTLFLLRRLPLGLIVGLKVVEANDSIAKVAIRYGYINQNPFKSIYFACLAMAAELATGILAMQAVLDSKEKVSMLVVKMEADFMKKATGKIIFTCLDGQQISEAVHQAVTSGDSNLVRVMSSGVDEKSGIEVARFYFTWSFKTKK